MAPWQGSRTAGAAGRGPGAGTFWALSPSLWGKPGNEEQAHGTSRPHKAPLRPELVADSFEVSLRGHLLGVVSCTPVPIISATVPGLGAAHTPPGAHPLPGDSLILLKPCSDPRRFQRVSRPLSLCCCQHALTAPWLARSARPVAQGRGEPGLPCPAIRGSIPPTRPTTLLTALLSPADDDAFEPAEASPPPPGAGGGEGALPRLPEQPVPTAGAPLADLEDSADSSSALLVPPDPAQGGSTPATEALPGVGRHSRGSLNTVV